MKCPKCHYLSFEPEARCRNCGYDLALADSNLAMREEDSHAELADWPLRTPPGSEGSAGSVGSGSRKFGQANVKLVEPEPPEPSELSEPAEPAASAPLRFAREARERLRQRRAAAAAVTSPSSAPAPVAESPSASSLRRPPRASSTTSELPLFVRGLADAVAPHPKGAAPRTVEQPPEDEFLEEHVFNRSTPDLVDTDDEPLVSVPKSPRQPLAVRRRAPEPRSPTAADGPDTAPRLPPPPGSFDLDLAEDLARLEQQRAQDAWSEAKALVRAAKGDTAGRIATPSRRLGAAIVDVMLLGGIGVTIVALTLRLCGLSTAEIAIIPPAPILAFFLLIAIGYLVLFTVASGQTLGKMILGLRIVAADSDDPESFHRLSPEQAATRAIMTLSSVLTFGVGFLPALVGDGRALHDRLAHTRVVRA